MGCGDHENGQELNEEHEALKRIAKDGLYAFDEGSGSSSNDDKTTFVVDAMVLSRMINRL
jgi:hypothetical protein